MQNHTSRRAPPFSPSRSPAPRACRSSPNALQHPKNHPLEFQDAPSQTPRTTHLKSRKHPLKFQRAPSHTSTFALQHPNARPPKSHGGGAETPPSRPAIYHNGDWWRKFHAPKAGRRARQRGGTARRGGGKIFPVLSPRAVKASRIDANNRKKNSPICRPAESRKAAPHRRKQPKSMATNHIPHADKRAAKAKRSNTKCRRKTFYNCKKPFLSHV